MWSRGNYESLLLDRSDLALVTVDRRILRSLAKGYPSRWTPPEDTDLGDGLEGRLLLDLYRAIFLANNRASQEELQILHGVSKGSRIPQIRARAAQSQCQLLLSDFLVRTYDRQPESAERIAKECRAICEVALQEFRDFVWIDVVTHQLHIALGILDYYAGDRLAAKFHLNRALEQYSHVRNRYDRYTWMLALGYYYSGCLANELEEFQNAVNYLSIAARAVPSPMKPGALVQLACALVKAGDPRRARTVAKRGLKSHLLQAAEKGIASELKGWLAEAELKLGDEQEATRLFREIIAADDAPAWSDAARKWLRHMHRDSTY